MEIIALSSHSEILNTVACGSQNLYSHGISSQFQSSSSVVLAKGFPVKCLRRSKQKIRKRQPSQTQGGNLKRDQTKALEIILRREAAKSNVDSRGGPKLSKKLLPKTVLEALSERIEKKSWESALKAFDIMKQQLWYKPNPRMYTRLIVMLGKCGLYERANLLFEEMIDVGLKPSVESYTALVSAYSRNGLLDKAFSILQTMKEIPDCQPDVTTYSILIKSCVEFSKFDCADKLLSEMAKAGIRPNTVTYNTILGAYGKAGKLKEMQQIISGMLENDECKPDVWTMNAAMRAFGGRGHITVMEEFYSTFQDMGIKSDIKTFNILIYSYGKERLYDKMTAVIEYMQKQHFSWTHVTFNIVIDAFGRAGDIEQMEYIFRLMVSEGIKPDSVTLCSLVSGYSKRGAIGKIASVLRKMESSDIVPDTVFYNSVIDAYARGGDLNEMEDMFIKMKERGCKPDNVSFCTMIKAYLSNGLVEKAKEMEEMMSGMNKNAH